ncbi:hypothetical protein Pla8534_26010 [Lignipirellula cremea]|uniref:Uncharacterized protein n=1 Tax=Lignipirellula cremea TaxID=2528010 RepID=A0A518DSJ4_9BACT|nr:hypothetical protein Pla8534_26010 [Lignipirellula cremea]
MPLTSSGRKTFFRQMRSTQEKRYSFNSDLNYPPSLTKAKVCSKYTPPQRLRQAAFARYLGMPERFAHDLPATTVRRPVFRAHFETTPPGEGSYAT